MPQSTVVSTKITKSTRRQVSTVSEPTPSTSPEEQVLEELCVLPGTSSSSGSAEQQDTILKLRIEQARLTQDFDARLGALERKTLGSTAPSPRPVFTPTHQSPPTSAFVNVHIPVTYQHYEQNDINVNWLIWSRTMPSNWVTNHGPPSWEQPIYKIVRGEYFMGLAIRRVALQRTPTDTVIHRASHPRASHE